MPLGSWAHTPPWPDEYLSSVHSNVAIKAMGVAEGGGAWRTSE